MNKYEKENWKYQETFIVKSAHDNIQRVFGFSNDNSYNC